MSGATDGSAEPLLVFLHIPKTAGTMVRYVIRSNEPATRHGKLGANVFGGGGGATKKVFEKLREEPERLDLDGVRIIHGHYPLAIRRHLDPAFPDRDIQYFTFLRDPVDRALSHFYNLRHRDDEEADAEDADLRVPSNIQTLDEAIAVGALHDNLQTRMLAGTANPSGRVTERTLARAKRNLRNSLAFVGISERMDESLVLAKRRLGFYDILAETGHRVNTSRPRGKEVPADLQESAERHNVHDIELYRFAVEQFDAAVEGAGLDFSVELAALQAARTSSGSRPPMAAPETFPGTPEEWELLVATQAELLRLRSRASRSVVRTIRLESRAQAKASPNKSGGKRKKVWKRQPERSASEAG